MSRLIRLVGGNSERSIAEKIVSFYEIDAGNDKLQCPSAIHPAG